jgi:hypothetical protein
LKERTHFSEGAERSWRIRRFLFYKCKFVSGFLCRWIGACFPFLGREFARCAKKTGVGNEEAEEGRALSPLAGDGDGRIGFLFASSVARRVKLFGWFWAASG